MAFPARRPPNAPSAPHLPGRFEHFETAGSRSDAGDPQLLKVLEIDIAVDLAGSSGHGRPKIFAFAALRDRGELTWAIPAQWGASISTMCWPMP